MPDSATPDPLQEQIAAAAAFIPALRAEIGTVLVGQNTLVDGLLIGLLANGHVLVEGVPGLAKTLAVRVLARAVGGRFARVQFTPDLLPADLIGTTVYNPQNHTFGVKKGPIFANLVLADEVNRAPAKVQSALLEAMQERQVTIGGETHVLPDPFLVMATQNPIEHEGTYPLPEAQLDRFLLKALVAYPSRAEEDRIVERMAHPVTDLAAVRHVVGPATFVEARQWVDKVHIAPRIAEYILDLIFATRPGHRAELSARQASVDLTRIEDMIEYGASPRAGLGLVLAAKAKAFLDARAYVTPQDVKDVAPAVLRHRLIPSYEAEAENLTADHLVAMLLDSLRLP